MEDKSMKRSISIICVTACLVILAAGANAQQQLNFANLPLVNSPSPIPSGYGQLNWGNFFYVNPYGWSGSGAGYRLGPKDEDVAFIGGESCRLSGNTCYGTLSSAGGFELVSANVAAGSNPEAIIVNAYTNGRFVGSANYFLTAEMRTLIFPSSWGVVTEVSIQSDGSPGDFVVYSLNLYTVVEDPPPLH
jgi:hypothetical protein